jgi:hypothetical protein
METRKCYDDLTDFHEIQYVGYAIVLNPFSESHMSYTHC